MLRVFVWMVVGMAVGYAVLHILMWAWAPSPRHLEYSLRTVWFVLTVTALVTGAIVGTLFGVADTVLRYVQRLSDEIRAQREPSHLEKASGVAAERPGPEK